ncbi:uncharacterized protein LOC128214574 [Mya arenaria]|uniref:uncharacterized protein LOC128214574 n=1 Tax=Mya arenaria TaxID=6604 RepID=UPI0022E48CD3|nr:uncharacterized protein LOC128214574 [Mya arenaria]
MDIAVIKNKCIILLVIILLSVVTGEEIATTQQTINLKSTTRDFASTSHLPEEASKHILIAGISAGVSIILLIVIAVVVLIRKRKGLCSLSEEPSTKIKGMMVNIYTTMKMLRITKLTCINAYKTTRQAMIIWNSPRSKKTFQLFLQQSFDLVEIDGDK